MEVVDIIIKSSVAQSAERMGFDFVLIVSVLCFKCHFVFEALSKDNSPRISYF